MSHSIAACFFCITLGPLLHLVQQSCFDYKIRDYLSAAATDLVSQNVHDTVGEEALAHQQYQARRSV